MSVWFSCILDRKWSYFLTDVTLNVVNTYDSLLRKKGNALVLIPLFPPFLLYFRSFSTPTPLKVILKNHFQVLRVRAAPCDTYYCYDTVDMYESYVGVPGNTMTYIIHSTRQLKLSDGCAGLGAGSGRCGGRSPPEPPPRRVSGRGAFLTILARFSL